MFPRHHPKGRVMPIAQMGLLNPARLVFPFLCFSPGSGKAGYPGRLALQGTGGRHLPGWPQPEGGGFLLLFSATPGRPWAAATRRGPRLSGLACGSHVMSDILLAREGPAPLRSAPRPFPGGRGGHPMARPPPLWAGGKSALTPCLGFPSPVGAPRSSGWL